MYSGDKIPPATGFWTPPARWEANQRDFWATPMTERKRFTPPQRGDHRFHAVHKVPAADSPYGRAKHVQLVEKDPSRAISLFWAAINAGDRVESALKDMAVVMKQLNRVDEAIEAIKSFRYLCPFESQDSLDNVLIELYKKSGRVEEEIEVLHRKLKNIEGGLASGLSSKLARSQGKKIVITLEQEAARVLGNLAWAHLRLHNYGIAEKYYRESLSLEPDKNKLCNLAVCLMHMNRVAEAKSLLHGVEDLSANETMDDSCTKSFQRALQTLVEVESSKSSRLKENQDPQSDSKETSANKNSGVLCTQPRTNSREVNDADRLCSSVRKLTFIQATTRENVLTNISEGQSPRPLLTQPRSGTWNVNMNNMYTRRG